MGTTSWYPQTWADNGRRAVAEVVGASWACPFSGESPLCLALRQSSVSPFQSPVIQAPQSAFTYLISGIPCVLALRIVFFRAYLCAGQRTALMDLANLQAPYILRRVRRMHIADASIACSVPLWAASDAFSATETF
jgi:hypothetical protein